jgi:hypothetical protein
VFAKAVKIILHNRAVVIVGFLNFFNGLCSATDRRSCGMNMLGQALMRAVVRNSLLQPFFAVVIRRSVATAEL